MTLEFIPCRFLSQPGGDLVPVVESNNPNDPELPCNCLSEFKRSASMVVRPIGTTGCLRQRKLGLCPRGFGPEVGPAFQLNSLAK